MTLLTREVQEQTIAYIDAFKAWLDNPPGSFVSPGGRLGITLARAEELGVLAAAAAQAYASAVIAAGLIMPTGTADHIAVNAAIAAGNKIVLGPGVFVVDVPIYALAKSNISISAQIPGTTIIRASASFSGANVGGTDMSGVVTLAGCSNYEISGLVIDLQTNAKAGNGIEVRPTGTTFAGTICSKGKIHDCSVFIKPATHAYGIWCVRCNDIKIYNNLIDGNDAMTAFCGHEGIEVVGGNRASVYGNKVQALGGHGIDYGGLTGVANMSLADVNVYDNDIDCFDGIAAGTIYDTAPQDLLRVTQWGNRIKYRHHGMEITYTSGNSSTPPKLHDLHSFANTWTCVGALTTDVIALVCTDMNETALADHDFRNITFSDDFIDSSSTDSGALIYAYHMAGLTLKGSNVIRTVNAGDQSSATFDHCDRIEILDSKFDGARIVGLYFIASTNLKVKRNTVRNWNLRGLGTSGIVFDEDCSVIDEGDNRFSTSAHTGASMPVRFDYGTDVVRYGRSGDEGTALETAIYGLNGGAPTNSNHGTVTAASGNTSYTVTTSLFRAGTMPRVYQISGGTLVAVGKIDISANSSFTFVLTGANNGAVYAWEFD